MNFCNVCGNMYYFKISQDESNTLKHFCRKCGNTDSDIFNNGENICISKTHIKKKQNIHNSIINEYTKLDPTLPRTKNIKCPNEQCNKNGESENNESKNNESENNESENNESEIIYLRYDNDNMKYIYLCSNCNYSWKNN